MRYDFDMEDKRAEHKKLLRKILIWIVEIAAVISLAYFLVTYGLERVNIVGDSMEPTLEDNDKILINKLSYRFASPKRFDVIVYKQSGKEHSYYTIRRVLALPGEKIQIKDGKVYINGKEIKERVKLEPMDNGGLAMEEIELDEGEYFVLGDNRNGSEDSRFANVGNIVEEDIIGKAWIRLNRFAFIHTIKNEIKKDTDEKEDSTKSTDNETSDEKTSDDEKSDSKTPDDGTADGKTPDSETVDDGAFDNETTEFE